LAWLLRWKVECCQFAMRKTLTHDEAILLGELAAIERWDADYRSSFPNRHDTMAFLYRQQRREEIIAKLGISAAPAKESKLAS